MFCDELGEQAAIKTMEATTAIKERWITMIVVGCKLNKTASRRALLLGPSLLRGGGCYQK